MKRKNFQITNIISAPMIIVIFLANFGYFESSTISAPYLTGSCIFFARSIINPLISFSKKSFRRSLLKEITFLQRTSTNFTSPTAATRV